MCNAKFSLPLYNVRRTKRVSVTANRPLTSVVTTLNPASILIIEFINWRFDPRNDPRNDNPEKISSVGFAVTHERTNESPPLVSRGCRAAFGKLIRKQTEN